MAILPWIYDHTNQNSFRKHMVDMHISRKGAKNGSETQQQRHNLHSMEMVNEYSSLLPLYNWKTTTLMPVHIA